MSLFSSTTSRRRAARMPALALAANPGSAGGGSAGCAAAAPVVQRSASGPFQATHRRPRSAGPAADRSASTLSRQASVVRPPCTCHAPPPPTSDCGRPAVAAMSGGGWRGRSSATAAADGRELCSTRIERAAQQVPAVAAAAHERPRPIPASASAGTLKPRGRASSPLSSILAVTRRPPVTADLSASARTADGQHRIAPGSPDARPSRAVPPLRLDAADLRRDRRDSDGLPIDASAARHAHSSALSPRKRGRWGGARQRPVPHSAQGLLIDSHGSRLGHAAPSRRSGLAGDRVGDAAKPGSSTCRAQRLVRAPRQRPPHRRAAARRASPSQASRTSFPAAISSNSDRRSPAAGRDRPSRG